MKFQDALTKIRSVGPDDSEATDLMVIEVAHEKIRHLFQEHLHTDGDEMEINIEQLAVLKKDFREWFKPLQEKLGIENGDDAYPGLLFDAVVNQAKAA